LLFSSYASPAIEIANKDAGCCKPAVVGYAVTDCRKDLKKTVLTGIEQSLFIGGVSVINAVSLIFNIGTFGSSGDSGNVPVACCLWSVACSPVLSC